MSWLFVTTLAVATPPSSWGTYILGEIGSTCTSTCMTVGKSCVPHIQVRKSKIVAGTVVLYSSPQPRKFVSMTNNVHNCTAVLSTKKGLFFLLTTVSHYSSLLNPTPFPGQSWHGIFNYIPPPFIADQQYACIVRRSWGQVQASIQAEWGRLGSGPTVVSSW